MVMPKLSLETFAALAPRMSSEQRRASAVAGVAHALHDGYTDLIYIMLPLWQAEFGLTFSALGLLRSPFVGAMASLQIPAGYLSERFGPAIVLALGTALAGLGYCFAGLSTGFVMLLGALLLSGIGASTQHPIASALVARAFAGAGSLKAIGAYNFAGDLWKMTVPAALSLMLLAMPWRPALFILGSLGIAIAAAILFAAPRRESAHAATRPDSHRTELTRKRQPLAFALLTSIGIVDSATRMGFLLFLPFVLTEKGATLQTVGLAMTLIFAGGAVGPVWLTEGLTAAGILSLSQLPLQAALLVLPLIGVALNGTSSVLYGSVPDLVEPQWRTRALSIFYTGTIGSGAIAPVLFGRLGDLLGVWPALTLVALFVLLTLPLAWSLRRPLALT